MNSGQTTTCYFSDQNEVSRLSLTICPFQGILQLVEVLRHLQGALLRLFLIN